MVEVATKEEFEALNTRIRDLIGDVNKRLDGIEKRLDDIDKRIDDVEEKSKSLWTRLREAVEKEAHEPVPE